MAAAGERIVLVVASALALGTALAAFLAMNVGVVAFIAFVLLVTFARQREDAQLRADDLLLNILPAEIADRLRRDPDTALTAALLDQLYRHAWDDENQTVIPTEATSGSVKTARGMAS